MDTVHNPERTGVVLCVDSAATRLPIVAMNTLKTLQRLWEVNEAVQIQIQIQIQIPTATGCPNA
jgi:hypothetical protein